MFKLGRLHALGLVLAAFALNVSPCPLVAAPSAFPPEDREAREFLNRVFHSRFQTEDDVCAVNAECRAALGSLIRNPDADECVELHDALQVAASCTAMTDWDGRKNSLSNFATSQDPALIRLRDGIGLKPPPGSVLVVAYRTPESAPEPMTRRLPGRRWLPWYSRIVPLYTAGMTPREESLEVSRALARSYVIECFGRALRPPDFMFHLAEHTASDPGIVEQWRGSVRRILSGGSTDFDPVTAMRYLEEVKGRPAFYRFVRSFAVGGSVEKSLRDELGIPDMDALSTQAVSWQRRTDMTRGLILAFLIVVPIALLLISVWRRCRARRRDRGTSDSPSIAYAAALMIRKCPVTILAEWAILRGNHERLRELVEDHDPELTTRYAELLQEREREEAVEEARRLSALEIAHIFITGVFVILPLAIAVATLVLVVYLERDQCYPWVQERLGIELPWKPDALKTPPPGTVVLIADTEHNRGPEMSILSWIHTIRPGLNEAQRAEQVRLIREAVRSELTRTYIRDYPDITVELRLNSATWAGDPVDPDLILIVGTGECFGSAFTVAVTLTPCGYSVRLLNRDVPDWAASETGFHPSAEHGRGEARAVDFDGDGRAEVLAVWDSGTRGYLCLNLWKRMPDRSWRRVWEESMWRFGQWDIVHHSSGRPSLILFQSDIGMLEHDPPKPNTYAEFVWDDADGTLRAVRRAKSDRYWKQDDLVRQAGILLSWMQRAKPEPE